MKIKYWPSLKHIALVRISLGIVCTFNFQAIKNDFFTSRGDVSEEYSSKLVSKIQSVLKGHASPFFTRNEIIGVVRSLVLEILKWSLSHNDIVSESDLDLWNIICWHSYGVIDRFKTAKVLIQNENITLERRFVLACKYFLEEQVQVLWNRLSVSAKVYTAAYYGDIASMRFWIYKIQTGSTIDSLKMFHTTKESEHFQGNYLGLRYYFKKLDPQAKYMCFSYGLTEGQIHHFDLYICFSEMNIDEVKTLFYHLSAPNRLIIIQLFLYWPLQSVFVDMVNQLWRYISQYNFRNILRFILRERIHRKWDDIDYMKIVEDIWERCPTPYKKDLKRDPIYIDLKLLFIYKFLSR